MFRCFKAAVKIVVSLPNPSLFFKSPNEHKVVITRQTGGTCSGPPLYGVLPPDWIKWAGIPEHFFPLLLLEQGEKTHELLTKNSHWLLCYLRFKINMSLTAAALLFTLCLNTPFSACLFKAPPLERPSQLWLVSSHRPEQAPNPPCFWHHKTMWKLWRLVLRHIFLIWAVWAFQYIHIIYSLTCVI